MISLELFRCRIGLFGSLHFKKSRFSTQSQKNISIGICLKHIPAALLCLLLLCSNIEPNPGPSFACKYPSCKMTFVDSSNYFHHHLVHTSQKSFRIPCPSLSCSRNNFQSLNALQIHLSIKHKNENKRSVVNEVSQPFSSCVVEDCIGLHRFTQKTDFIRHMVLHLQAGKQFECPYDDCSTVHSVPAYFRTHMSRKHRDEEVPIAQKELKNPQVPCDVQNDCEVSECVETPTESPASSDPCPYHSIKLEIANFYLKLEGFNILPFEVVQMISREIALLSRMSHHCLKKALLKEMTEKGIANEAAEIIINNSFVKDPVYNVHHKHADPDQLSSQYFRSIFLKKHFSFVPPQEINLGVDASNKRRRAYYVPITDTLNARLKEDNIKAMILKSFTMPEKQTF